MPLTSHEDIKHLLETAITVAVVGYSNDPEKPSHEVTTALENFGYDVYKVNPTLEANSSQKIYQKLADIPVKIDVVDIFRRAEAVPEVVKEAIAVGAKAIWMQLGIINNDAVKQAEEAGLQAVQNRCMKVEHQRLIDKAFNS